MAAIETMPVTVRTAEMQLRHPRELVTGIFTDLIRSRHVAWEMMKRDLKSQYRTSIMGVLIPLLPALTTAAWAILFRDAHIINVGNVNMPYPFFVLTGMMLWASFLKSMDAPISGVMAEQQLLSKADIPAEAITVARVGQVLVNFGIKSLIIMIAAIAYRLHVPWTIVLAPLGLLMMVMLGATVGLIIAPLNLLYTDIAKAIPIFTTLWFFSTPIVFVAPKGGAAAIIMNKINPVTPLLTATRDLAFGHGLTTPGSLEAAVIFTVCLFLIALLFHRIAMPIVIDRANA